MLGKRVARSLGVIQMTSSISLLHDAPKGSPKSRTETLPCHVSFEVVGEFTDSDSDSHASTALARAFGGTVQIQSFHKGFVQAMSGAHTPGRQACLP